MIFIEREHPVTMDALNEKLALLRKACSSDERVRRTMRIVVPTYKSPEEVNRAVS